MSNAAPTNSLDALLAQKLQAVTDAAAANTTAAVAAAVGPLQQQIAALQAKVTPVPVLPLRKWLGTNVTVNSYWSTDARWANVMLSASGWYGENAFAGTHPDGSLKLKYTPDNFPLGDAACYHQMLGNPIGDYPVTWLGKCIPTCQWGNFTQTGPNSGVLHVTQLNQQIYWHLTGLDSTQPLTSFCVWRPGYGPGTAKAGQVYTDEYLAFIKTFGYVRVMGDQNTNDTTEHNWADRVTGTMFDQTSRGVALEYAIELANEANVGLWVCMPPKSTPDYWTNAAKLLLTCKTFVVVEYANEDWNSGMQVAYAWNYAQANDPAQLQNYDGNLVNGKIVPGATVGGVYQPVTDSLTRAMRRVGEQVRSIGQVFKPIWPARPNDLKIVYSGADADSRWLQNGTQWLVAKYGLADLHANIDLLSVALYIDVDYSTLPPKPATEQSWWNPAWTLDQMFAAMDVYLTGTFTPWLKTNKATADSVGLPLVAYEGGQSIYAWQDGFTPFDPATFPNTVPYLMQYDPRMGAEYDKMFAVAHANGVAGFCQLASIGNWTKDGFWSAVQSYADMAASPRWAAILREVAK